MLLIVRYSNWNQAMIRQYQEAGSFNCTIFELKWMRGIYIRRYKQLLIVRYSNWNSDDLRDDECFFELLIVRYSNWNTVINKTLIFSFKDRQDKASILILSSLKNVINYLLGNYYLASWFVLFIMSGLCISGTGWTIVLYKYSFHAYEVGCSFMRCKIYWHLFAFSRRKYV